MKVFGTFSLNFLAHCKVSAVMKTATVVGLCRLLGVNSFMGRTFSQVRSGGDRAGRDAVLTPSSSSHSLLLHHHTLAL